MKTNKINEKRDQRGQTPMVSFLSDGRTVDGLWTDMRRTTDGHVTDNGRTSDGHVTDMCATSNEHESNMNRTSIEHQSNMNGRRMGDEWEMNGTSMGEMKFAKFAKFAEFAKVYFTRVAAMLLMLVTLSVGQMWGATKTYNFDGTDPLSEWNVTKSDSRYTVAVTNSLQSIPVLSGKYLGFSIVNNSGNITIRTTQSFENISNVSFKACNSDNSNPTWTVRIIESTGTTTLANAAKPKDTWGASGTNKWSNQVSLNVATPKTGYVEFYLNSGSSGKYAALDELVITYAPSAPSNKTIYLKPAGNWADGTKTYVWDATHSNFLASAMTAGEGCNSAYLSLDVPSDCNSIVFVRMQNTAGAGDWDTKWGQTKDFDCSTNNLYTLTGSQDSGDGYKYPGSGSTFAPSFSVTFDANGHGSDPASKCVTSGTKTTAPTAPTASGYTFGGWYKEAGCTNEWNFGSDVVTEDVTLYAKWTEKPWQINGSFDGWKSPHDLTGTASSATYTYTGLTASTTYEFGLLNPGGTFFKSKPQATITSSSTSATLGTEGSNTKITTTLAGDYTFTVDYTNASAPVVTVTYPVPVIKVSSITLDKTAVSLKQGENVTLVATVLPDNAADKSINWTSSNAKVTVNSTGKVTVASDATIGSTATITATAADGSGKTATCVVTVVCTNYLKSPEDAFTTISAATTWNFENSTIKGLSNNVEFGNATCPQQNEEFIWSNLNFATGVSNGSALKVEGQRVNKGGYFQGRKFKFTTTVPGTVTVKFASNSDSKTRGVDVNGTKSTTTCGNYTAVTTEAISVAAGEVVVQGYQSSDLNQYLRWYSITFTPTPEEATWQIAGQINGSWTPADLTDNSYYEANLEASRNYAFKIVKKVGSTSTWYTNGGTITEDACTDVAFSEEGGENNNTTLTTTIAGTYRIGVNTTGATPVVTVTYPSPLPHVAEAYYIYLGQSLTLAEGVTATYNASDAVNNIPAYYYDNLSQTTKQYESAGALTIDGRQVTGAKLGKYQIAVTGGDRATATVYVYRYYAKYPWGACSATPETDYNKTWKWQALDYVNIHELNVYGLYSSAAGEHANLGWDYYYDWDGLYKYNGDGTPDLHPGTEGGKSNGKWIDGTTDAKDHGEALFFNVGTFQTDCGDNYVKLTYTPSVDVTGAATPVLEESNCTTSDGNSIKSTFKRLTYIAKPAEGGVITHDQAGDLVPSGTEVTFHAEAKAGYVFAGWFTDADCKSEITGASVDAEKRNHQHTVTANYTVYAKFNSICTAVAIHMEGNEHKNLEIGETNQLYVTYTPETPDYGGEVATWAAVNTSVLTVSSTGLVTAVSPGTTTVTATTTNGVVSAAYSITVNSFDCDTWYIHAWNGGNIRNYCMHQEGEANEWRTDEVRLPSASNDEKVTVLKVGETPSKKADWNNNWVPMVGQQVNSCKHDDQQYYAGHDALGYYRIFANSSDENYFLAFQPTYVMVMGKDITSSSKDNPIEFTRVSGENYQTGLVQVPAGYKTDASYKYYVGTKRHSSSSNSPWIYDGKSSLDALNGVSGLSATDLGGTYGKFSINADWCDANFYCTFIPYYNVSYYVDGAFVENSEFKVSTETEANRTISFKAAVEKTGYTFQNWKRYNSETTIDAGASYAVWTGMERFDAQFTPTTYTITYNLDGGTNAGGNPANYTIETATINLAAPTKTDYTFEGWYTEAGFVNKVTTIVLGSTGNVTLYAKWTEDAPGGETCVTLGKTDKDFTTNTTKTFGNVTIQTVGLDYTQSLPKFDNSGDYVEITSTVDLVSGTVTGKLNSSSGTNPDIWFGSDASHTTKSSISMNGETEGTYAMPSLGEGVRYIKIQRNGTSLFIGGLCLTTGSCTPSSYTLKHGSDVMGTFVATGNANEYSVVVEFTNDNINGQYIVDNCGNRYGNGQLNAGDCLTLTEGETATYNTGGASQNLHWKFTFNSGTKSLCLDDTPEEDKTYSITYECDDATSGCPANVASAKTLPNPLATPEKTGYTFDGWFTNSAKTEAAVAGATLTADVTLYAKWDAVSYTITVNDEGAGQHDCSKNTSAHAGETVTITNTCVVSGYTLTGYNSTPEVSGTFTPATGVYTFTMPAENVTLEAVWVEDAPEGECITWNLTLTSGASNVVTGTKTTSTHLTNMSDVTLQGVSPESGTGKTTVTPKIETPESYDASKYVYVTFKVADGYAFHPTSVTLSTVAVSTTKTLKLELTDGRNSTSATKTNLSTSADPVESVLNSFEDVALQGTVTLKIYCYGATNKFRLGTPITICGTVEEAEEPTTYTITYDCDDAESGCPEEETDAVALPNPLPSAPVKTGKNFGGWYTDSEKTVAAVAGSAISANTTLYAKWVEPQQDDDCYTSLLNDAPTGATVSASNSVEYKNRGSEAWIDSEYTRYVRATSSSGSVTYQFGPAIELTSDEVDAGTITIHYAHDTSDKRSFTMKVNGSNAGSYSIANRQTMYAAEYTIPKGTASINTIQLIGGGSSSGYCWFDVEICTHNGSGATKYTITYDANGGTGTMTAARQYVEGAEVTIKANEFTAPSGQEFDHWTAEDGEGNAIAITDGEFIMPASNVTIYANWRNIAVTGVSLNKTATELTLGGATETLTATVTPDGAANKSVTWSSSNESVVTVENGVITAVAVGVATITVTTVDGSKTATCEVTVKAAAIGGAEVCGTFENSGSSVDSKAVHTLSSGLELWSCDSKKKPTSSANVTQGSGVKSCSGNNSDFYYTKKYFVLHHDSEDIVGLKIKLYNGSVRNIVSVMVGDEFTSSSSFENVTFTAPTNSAKNCQELTVTFDVIEAGKYIYVELSGDAYTYEICYTPAGNKATLPVLPTLNNLTKNIGEDASWDANVTNAAAIAAADETVTYLWQDEDGTTLSTTAELTLNDVTMASAGKYTVTATVSGDGKTSNSVSKTVTLTVTCSDVMPEVYEVSRSTIGCTSTVTMGARRSDNHSAYGEGGFQWYLDDEPISGATEATYTSARAGIYKVAYTNLCTTMSTTSVEIASSQTEPEAKRLAPFQYCHMNTTYADNRKLRHLFWIKPVGEAAGETYLLTAKIDEAAVELPAGAIETEEANGGLNILVNLNVLNTGDFNIGDDIVLTVQPYNSCNAPSTTITESITIHVIDETPTLAFIVSGTNEAGGTKDKKKHAKGGDFLTGVNVADLCLQTALSTFDAETELPLYATLKDNFTVTPVNGYAKFNKLNYEPFDLVFLTDFPKTDVDADALNDLAKLVDYRPIFSTKSYVSGLSQWQAVGFKDKPNDTKVPQLWMNITCESHTMFQHGGIDFATIPREESNDEPVFTMLTGAGFDKSKALQGFDVDDADDFIHVAYTHYNATAGMEERDGHTYVNPTNVGSDDKKIIVSVERQKEMDARLIMLVLNADATSNLTEQGMKVIVSALNYLLITDENEIVDCSLTFDNNHGTGDGNWETATNWTDNRVPLATEKVRIIAPCTVSTADVAAAEVKICTGSTSFATHTGSLTIAAGGALSVTGKVVRVENGHYFRTMPTEVGDVFVAANGAFVHGDKVGETKATVQMYSIASGDLQDGSLSNAKWQWMTTPLNDLNDVEDFFYGAWMYTWNNESHGWNPAITNGTSMTPFGGYSITQAAPMTYTMNGTLVETADKEITLYNGLNLIGNSWTAPINIQQLDESDFVNAEATIVLFNTGTDVSGTGSTTTIESAATADCTDPGTYVSIPVNVTGELAASLQVIPSMQAFEIRATGANASLTLDYDKIVRKGDNNINIQPMRAPRRTAEEWQGTNDINERLRIYVQGSRYGDYVYIFQHDATTMDFDNGWDGRKYLSDNLDIPALVVRNSTVNWQISTQPELVGTKLAFYQGEDDTYTMGFDYIGYETLWLYDSTEDRYAEVKTGNTYTFSSNTTKLQKRFVLTNYNPNAPQEPGIATGVDDVSPSDGGPRKLILDDKLYILNNGRLYDATGRLAY